MTFHPFQVPFPVALFIQKIQVNLVAELATIIEVVKTDLWMRVYFSSIYVHIHPNFAIGPGSY